MLMFPFPENIGSFLIKNFSFFLNGSFDDQATKKAPKPTDF